MTRNASDPCGVGGRETEVSAWQYARTEQGYAGTLDEWLVMHDDEREAYERGAAGGDEPAPFRRLGPA